MTDQRIKDAETFEAQAQGIAGQLKAARRQLEDLAEAKAKADGKAEHLRQQIQMEQDAIRFAAEAKEQTERFAREEEEQRQRHQREWQLANRGY
jgi:hypothetical protein